MRNRATAKQHVFYTVASGEGGFTAYQVDGLHWDGPGGGSIESVTSAAGGTEYQALGALCAALARLAEKGGEK